MQEKVLENEDKKNQIDHKQLFQTEYQKKPAEISQYKSFFSQFNIDEYYQKQLLLQKLRCHGFVVNQGKKIKDNKCFYIQISQKSYNLSITEVTCYLGNYQKSILIFNDNSSNQSQTHNLKLIYFGDNRQIYDHSFKSQSSIIKCVKFDQQKRGNYQSILMSIREYFITLLMSALQLGPKVHNLAGFDMILNKSCIQFFIQKCKPISQMQINKKQLNQLKLSLRMMHLLKIVHLDIKPSNIMYSKQFKKIVFIDFGLSQFIKQQLGCKTFTAFRGTALYCSQQMFQCYSKKRYVDLYSNDIVSLQKSFEQISLLKPKQKQFLNQQNFQQLEQQKLYASEASQQFYAKSMMIQLKYYLFKNLFEQSYLTIQTIKREQLNKNLATDILLFLLELPFSSQIWSFIHQNDKLANFKTSNQYQHFIRRYPNNNQPIFGQIFIFDKNQQVKRTYLIYQILLLIKNQKQNFLSKNKIKEYLLIQKAFFNIQNYIKLVSGFLSFWNNSFHTTLQQKFQVSQYFLNNFKQKLNINDHEIQQIFHSSTKNNQKSIQLSQKMTSILACIKILIVYLSKISIPSPTLNVSVIMLDFWKQLILIQQDFYRFYDFFYQMTVLKQSDIVKKVRNAWIVSYDLRKIIQIKLKKKLVKNQCLTNKIAQCLQQKQKLQNQLNSQKLKQDYKLKKQYLQNFINVTSDLLLLFQQKNFLHYQAYIQEKIQLFQKIVKTQLKNLSDEYLNYATQISILLDQFYHLIFYPKHLDKLMSILQNHFNIKFIVYYNSFKFKIFNIDYTFIEIFYSLRKFQKLNNTLKVFDHKINCQQISQKFFTFQRIALAYIKQDQAEINKYSDLIFRQETVNFKNKQILRKSVQGILVIACQGKFGVKQFNKKILNWMILVIQYLTSSLKKVKDEQIVICECDAVINICDYSLSILLQSTQYLSKLNLSQVTSDIQTINDKISQKACRFSFVRYMIKYYTTVQQNFRKKSQIILNFVQKMDKDIITSIRSQNFIMLVSQVIKIKRSLLQNEDNYSDFLLIFDLVNSYNCAKIYIAGMFIGESVYLALFKNYKQKLILQFFKQLALQVKFDSSESRCNSYIRILNLIQSCPFSQNQKLIQFCDLIFQQDIFRSINTWNYSYISLLFLSLLKRLKSLNQNNTRKMLLFITKSFKYVSFFTKQYIFGDYYQFSSKLNINFNNKSKLLKRKHLSVTCKYYDKQSLIDLYFYNLKKVRKKQNNTAFFKLFEQKLLKFHENRGNIKKDAIVNNNFPFKSNSNKKKQKQIQKQVKQQFLFKIQKFLHKIKAMYS